MYAINNTDAAFVTELLMGDYSRKMQHVPVTAYSFCDAVLFQLSHDKAKYKSIILLQQIAFHMVKWPEKCYEIAKPFLQGNSYESYVKNVFHGTKYIDVNVMTAVITMMWNLSINVVYPSRGSIPFHHRNVQPDIVITNNEMEHPENYYCATRPVTDNWRPVKGKDWTNQIKIFSNVKNAHSLAEKRLRQRCVDKVVNEFNEVTKEINTMKDSLNLYEDQIKSLNEKVQTWKFNVAKMEGKQGVLRLRLLEFGVDVNNLTKSGPALEGIHYTVPTSSTTGTTSTISTPPDSNLNLEVSLKESSQMTIVDIHHTQSTTSTVSVAATTSSSTISTVSAAISSATSTETSSTVSTVPTATTSTVSTAPSGTSSTVSLVPTSAQGQLIPLSATQILQLLTPGASAVGCPQQLVHVAGQNILISGSGPGTIGASSIRYGKILKGTHKYFCGRCKRPFTQKESLNRHEQENCPMLEAGAKKRYKCDTCQADFSSKQYLKEHVHIEHLKTPCYKCKRCGKEFFKHCNLSFHKKSCLGSLVPGFGQTPQQTAAQGTPLALPQANINVQQQGDPGVQQQGDPGVQQQGDPQGDPLVGGADEDEAEFTFANPMHLPDL